MAIYLIFCDFALLLRCGVVFGEFIDRLLRFSETVYEIYSFNNVLSLATLISYLTVIRQL